MQAALGDALAVALLESRGFTALDFRSFHPGGRLGAMLKFVSNIMHAGDAIPLVALGTRMADAVVEMSTKGFGCVVITDADGMLAGIITDGDLRRHMRAGLLDDRVEDVMTCSPRTVRPDQLASEALEIINSSQITALIVADAGKPVGIVSFHDLLRAGVACQIHPSSSRSAICRITSMPGALSLRQGIAAKFSPPCFLKMCAFSTAISSSVSRQSEEKPGVMTARFFTPLPASSLDGLIGRGLEPLGASEPRLESHHQLRLHRARAARATAAWSRCNGRNTGSPFST